MVDAITKTAPNLTKVIGAEISKIGKFGNVRVKIHPPDASTDYSHIHIYDKAGNSLTPNLTRAPYDLPDVHIRVEPIQKELEWSLRRQK